MSICPSAFSDSPRWWTWCSGWPRGNVRCATAAWGPTGGRRPIPSMSATSSGRPAALRTTTMSNASSIRSKALELGFEKVGIARAGAAPRAEFLEPWLGKEFHGEMAYMARTPERRVDPARILSGARSLVCVVKNYQSPGEHSADPRIGRISRYAWGNDYHDVLKAKLQELGKHIERLGGNAKVCVDTNAVLEKPWAQEAGLGWQGKHSNLISRDIGSWYFLGEVLTDLELEPDAPHQEEYCGTCTACIDLCPTK